MTPTTIPETSSTMVTPLSSSFSHFDNDNNNNNGSFLHNEDHDYDGNNIYENKIKTSTGTITQRQIVNTHMQSQTPTHVHPKTKHARLSSQQQPQQPQHTSSSSYSNSNAKSALLSSQLHSKNINVTDNHNSNNIYDNYANDSKKRKNKNVLPLSTKNDYINDSYENQEHYISHDTTNVYDEDEHVFKQFNKLNEESEIRNYNDHNPEKFLLSHDKNIDDDDVDSASSSSNNSISTDDDNNSN